MAELLASVKQTRASVPQFDWGLKAILVVSVLCFLSKWTANNRPSYSKQFIKQVQQIVRNATNSQEVAEQDKNPLMGLLNVTTAIAYLNASRKFAKDQDIARITGLHVDEVMAHLEERQQSLIQTIGSTCPAVRLTSVYTPV